MERSWKNWPLPAKFAGIALTILFVAAVAYVLLTLVLIGLGQLGIGDT